MKSVKYYKRNKEIIQDNSEEERHQAELVNQTG